jgi:hypothetical protein
MKTIEEMIQELPPEAQQEGREFVESVYRKYHRERRQGFKFNWEGALEDMREQYTSVERNRSGA